MPKIRTPFAGAPDEVSVEEYGALKRQGLLATSGPADADPEPDPVEVPTKFGHTVTVSPDEAAALRRQGLTAEPATASSPAKTRGPETTPTTKEDG